MINNKYFLFLAFCFVLFPIQGHAQNKIVVIQEDGTKAEVMVDQPVLGPKTEQNTVPKKTESSPTMRDLMAEPELYRPPKIEPKKVRAPTPAPIKPKIKKTEKAAPKKKMVSVPYPPHKPSEAEILQALNLQKTRPVIKRIDPKNIPEGTLITKDLAVRVALEVSPPSRGFQVFTTTYESRPVYQVRFKTENGPHDIVVDADTGKILKK